MSWLLYGRGALEVLMHKHEFRVYIDFLTSPLGGWQNLMAKCLDTEIPTG